MICFAFEKDLVNEVVARWVAEHPKDPECRKVLDAHLEAQRMKTKETAVAYEKALRELWIIRPWDVERSGLLLKTRKSPCLVKGGL